jgi:hypothetical protein
LRIADCRFEISDLKFEISNGFSTRLGAPEVPKAGVIRAGVTAEVFGGFIYAFSLDC